MDKPYETFKLRGGVEFGVNSSGCLVYCNDWETLSGTPTVSEPHRGVNRDLFQSGTGISRSHYFATEKFCKATGFVAQ